MTTRETKLDAIAQKIKSAPSLWDLREALIEFEYAVAFDDDGSPHFDPDTESELNMRGLNIAELPVFGGEAPKSTADVWSWDEDSLLVGVGPFADWEIRDRK